MAGLKDVRHQGDEPKGSHAYLRDVGAKWFPWIGGRSDEDELIALTDIPFPSTRVLTTIKHTTTKNEDATTTQEEDPPATSEDSSSTEETSSPTKETSSEVTTTSKETTLATTTSPLIPSSIVEATPTSDDLPVGGPTADGSETLITAPSDTGGPAPSIGAAESAPLPTSAVAGIAVGGASAGIIAAILLFFFIRRRRRSRDGSSVRAESPPPGYDDDKFVGTGTSLSQPTGLSSKPASRDANAAEDVFAPFGGRANSQRAFFNPLTAHPPLSRSTTRSFADAGPSMTVSSTQATQGTHNGEASDSANRGHSSGSGGPQAGYGARSVAREVTIVRPESQPRCIDVDSTGDATPAPSPVPTARPAASHVGSSSSQGQEQGAPVSRYNYDARPKYSTMPQSHPAPLVPGYPGMQRRMQSAPGQHGTPTPPPPADARQEQQHPQLRPNLDLTPGEREKNRHVGSWDKY